ncbi:NSFL1 cofactor p47 [Hypsibius exemplaris]|uniref:NSFL1 cofactor p47 n=1 Tax=Hypsibius exemplaris TaxID=2072580 RepID=A0A9X6RKX8_HYPEX|nr:NSFL1 cofactor p47 [Hypsibius exemplaris]
MADHDEMVSQFINMTGSDADRAKFYLESSNWDIGPALETYFESGAGAGHDVDMDMMEDHPQDVRQQQHHGGAPQQHHGGAPQQNPYPPVVGQRNPGNFPTAPSAPKQVAPIPVNPPSSSARIATMSSIRKLQAQHEDESSDEEHNSDDEQKLYVGSGQEVIGPGKKPNPERIIKNVFQSARAQGAKEVEEPQAQRGHGAARPFGGAGSRLGDSSGSAAPSGTSASTPVAGSAAGKLDKVTIILRMYRNGFTVDNGPLREFDDPVNQDFLRSMKRGEVPRELADQARGRELGVDMVDNRNQDYEVPKQQPTFFGGTGHMLGSPTPAVVMKPSAASLPASSETEKKNAEEKARNAVTVDAAQPATNIQIRLPDGSRLVNRFNEAHTVADVRRYIQLARPELSSHAFQMLAGFPLKPLSDETASLKEANLLGAAINVK